MLDPAAGLRCRWVASRRGRPEQERGFPNVADKTGDGNSRGELKELGAASSVRWRGPPAVHSIARILAAVLWPTDQESGVRRSHR